jgi:hypothetical protein
VREHRPCGVAQGSSPAPGVGVEPDDRFWHTDHRRNQRSLWDDAVALGRCIAARRVARPRVCLRRPRPQSSGDRTRLVQRQSSGLADRAARWLDAIEFVATRWRDIAALNRESDRPGLSAKQRNQWLGSLVGIAYDRRVRTLIMTVAAMVVLAVPAVASSTASMPVIAYDSSASLASSLYVTGPSGTHRVGTGQSPSVAPDGLIVSGSALGSVGPALTLYATTGNRSHSFFSDSNGRVIAYPLAWSRDSRYLAVRVSTGTVSRLVVIDTTTMRAKMIATGTIMNASFAPTGPDRLVYGWSSTPPPAHPPLSPSTDIFNLYMVNPNGSDHTQLTTNGNSFHPLWTVNGIVYDLLTSRGAVHTAFTAQLWLLHDGHPTQLNVTDPGLVPLAASSNANRVIADYVGADREDTIAIQLSPRRIRNLTAANPKARFAGISPDGRTLLLDVSRDTLPSDKGVVETVPFGGGKATRIASGIQAAWNG